MHLFTAKCLMGGRCGAEINIVREKRAEYKILNKFDGYQWNRLIVCPNTGMPLCSQHMEIVRVKHTCGLEERKH